MGVPPFVGAGPLTEQWFEDRFISIGASDSAAACGLSEDRNALDVYCEKRRLCEPFEGNEFTRRGKRAEPFILGEYVDQTGFELETDLPMYFHGVHRHISATPDARRKGNPKHLVEAKLCNWRRAASLGEEHSDQIFPDWLCQAQQQIGVMDAEVCDVYVMLDIHTYRMFTVERKDALIEAMFEIENELWDRIERGDPPAPNFAHPKAIESIKKLFGQSRGTIELSDEAANWWAQMQVLKAEIKDREEDLDELKARLLFELGDAAAGRLPLGTKEIARSVVSESYWTQTDIDVATQSLGKVKREGYVKLIERKVKQNG